MHEQHLFHNSNKITVFVVVGISKIPHTIISEIHLANLFYLQCHQNNLTLTKWPCKTTSSSCRDKNNLLTAIVVVH